jgi:cardiolipin synthase
VVEALQRAAARKVICRVMADGLGSRTIAIESHWKAMQAAGVQVATALPIGNPSCVRCADASIAQSTARFW